MPLDPRDPRRTAPGGLLLLAGLALLLLAGRADAQCPASALTFPSIPQFLVNAAVFDTTSPDGGRIRADLHTLEFFLHHPGSLSPTDLVARDRYDVTGVPPGTPVPVTVHFDIVGFAHTEGCGGTGCGGELVATLRAGAASSQGTFFGYSFVGRGDFSGRVDLPVTLVAGVPVVLEFELWSRRVPGGSHTVDANGRVSFEGADPNATIVSCQGYGPRTVPVEGTSWGRLKRIYR